MLEPLTQKTKDQHLFIDPYQPGGLNTALISFVASETNQRIDLEKHSADQVAVKIRGGFESAKAAVEHVGHLDRTIDTYAVDMYKWTLVGNVHKVTDGLHEHHLVDMIKAHKKRNADAKEAFDARKKQVMDEGLEDQDIPDHVTAKADAKAKTEGEDEGEDDIVVPLAEGATATDKNKPSLNDRDYVTVPGQSYAILSVVERDLEMQEIDTPQGVIGIKIRGVFETREQAEAHMEKLGKLDPDFDQLLCDMYRFSMCPPELEKVEQIKYRDEYLNNLFGGYEKSKEEAAAFQMERDMIPHVERNVHPAELAAETAVAAVAGPSK